MIDKRQQERHLIRQRIISFLQECKKVIPNGVIVMFLNVQFFSVFLHILRAEQADLLAAEGEFHRWCNLPLTDPAGDRSGVDEVLSRQLFLTIVIPILFFKGMDVHFHDPFHALCDAIDLDHLSRQVILSGDIAERNIQ